MWILLKWVLFKTVKEAYTFMYEMGEKWKHSYAVKYLIEATHRVEEANET